MSSRTIRSAIKTGGPFGSTAGKSEPGEKIDLDRELRLYRNLFQSRRLILPNEARIRQTLKSGFPHLQPKEKGTLRILAIYHRYNWGKHLLEAGPGKIRPRPPLRLV